MTTQSTPNLGLALPVTGELSGTWGDVVNASLTSLVDSAIAGYTTVSVTTANQAFTSTALVANQARSAIIRLTTTTTASFSVYAPPVSKVYVIWNNSGYTATIYNSTVAGNTTAAGTGIAIADGDRVVVFTNGTNFYDIKASSITGVLPVVNGGTGSSTASGARTNLGLVIGTDVPSPTGTGASGTWSISINGNAATATSATSATNATNATNSTTQAAKTSDTTIATTEFSDRFRSFFTGSTSGTASITDRGCLLIASGGITVPASIFAANDAFTIINNTASGITLTQGSGLTMYWAGAGSTGNRTLASRGLATIVFVSGTVCYVVGGGLT